MPAAWICTAIYRIRGHFSILLACYSLSPLPLRCCTACLSPTCKSRSPTITKAQPPGRQQSSAIAVHLHASTRGCCSLPWPAWQSGFVLAPVMTCICASRPGSRAAAAAAAAAAAWYCSCRSCGVSPGGRSGVHIQCPPCTAAACIVA
ncbi:hypothetical protein BD289DRAFT_420957 [Coniella lustricola]|uniref:Secreted protein n=1 Tax=Coniella lustricola TaxID=2025994 RepID=A0A2T3AMP0_9PEZI|nr:hypothetical protein BD289DRAFT_420957 [Coniella lustricola]